MSYLLLEYLCPGCESRLESLERRAAPAVSIPCDACGGIAERTISAVRCGIVWGAVSTGTSDAPPPGAIDTRPLADGQPYKEWRAERARGRADELRAGLVDRKVFV